jgi:hypothetical protein
MIIVRDIGVCELSGQDPGFEFTSLETKHDSNAFRSFFLYSEVHALVFIVASAKDGMWYNHGKESHFFLSDPTMFTNPSLLLSKAEWCRYYIHLTIFEPQPF